jgi:hypothetical protein
MEMGKGGFGGAMDMLQNSLFPLPLICAYLLLKVPIPFTEDMGSPISCGSFLDNFSLVIFPLGTSRKITKINAK